MRLASGGGWTVMLLACILPGSPAAGLAQAARPDYIERAREIATRMGFSFEYRFTGYGDLGTRLRALAARQDSPAWPV